MVWAYIEEDKKASGNGSRGGGPLPAPPPFSRQTMGHENLMRLLWAESVKGVGYGWKGGGVGGWGGEWDEENGAWEIGYGQGQCGDPWLRLWMGGGGGMSVPRFGGQTLVLGLFEGQNRIHVHIRSYFWQKWYSAKCCIHIDDTDWYNPGREKNVGPRRVTVFRVWLGFDKWRLTNNEHLWNNVACLTLVQMTLESCWNNVGWTTLVQMMLKISKNVGATLFRMDKQNRKQRRPTFVCYLGLLYAELQDVQIFSSTKHNRQPCMAPTDGISFTQGPCHGFKWEFCRGRAGLLTLSHHQNSVNRQMYRTFVFSFKKGQSSWHEVK